MPSPRRLTRRRSRKNVQQRPDSAMWTLDSSVVSFPATPTSLRRCTLLVFSLGSASWCDSGVPEFPEVTEAMLREVLPQLAAWDLPLMVHAELPGPIAAAAATRVVRRYTDYASTPPGDRRVRSG